MLERRVPKSWRRRSDLHLAEDLIGLKLQAMVNDPRRGSRKRGYLSAAKGSQKQGTNHRLVIAQRVFCSLQARGSIESPETRAWLG